jgi:uncharacterized protein (DUF1786 family)
MYTPRAFGQWPSLCYTLAATKVREEWMQILAVDIGTGTQDVLLFDTDQEPENALKMVMPSPTVLLARAIRDATRAGADLLLTGVTMGGGPCG